MMEASVDLSPRGPDWMPITPKTGSLFHAETQRATATASGEVGRGKPDNGVCPATGGHPAPRQERSLYQPLARTDDGLGRPRCAAWRFDLARIQLGSHGTGRHACQFRENRRNGPCSL